MDIANINTVYFSATYTTRKVVGKIAEQICDHITKYDITIQPPSTDVVSQKGDLFIFGMPVYAGRIPASAAAALDRFKGDQTPAIIVCVYGNREYDDALLELKETVEANGFKVLSAGAFVAQHSIFPKVAAGRPDEEDMAKVSDFAQKNAALISQLTDGASIPELSVNGNRPYKQPGSIPIHPAASKLCNKCGACVKLCPAGAIAEDNPRATDSKKCISCGRCITICPQKARRFGGLLYKAVACKFEKDNRQRKEPEVFMPTWG